METLCSGPSATPKILLRKSTLHELHRRGVAGVFILARDWYCVKNKIALRPSNELLCPELLPSFNFTNSAGKFWNGL